MYRLYLFLFKYRVALVFIILESISFWLIVQNNRYQSAAFFNSANAISGNLLSLSADVRNYFFLKKTNADLAEEISRLRKELEKRNATPAAINVSSNDTIPFNFINAKVVSNSVYNFNNYLTINSGTEAGVRKDMGVIGNKGIVGKVKYASSNFAVVTSLLHSNFVISSKVEDKINLCSTKWGGADPKKAQLLYVPTHINLEKGDTVSTSGFNSIFPEGVLIGTIDEITLSEGAPFYEISIVLSTEFANIAYVQVIQSNNKIELDSLDAFKEGL